MRSDSRPAPGALLLAFSFSIALCAGKAEAQARAFLFTVTTVQPSPSDAWTVAYDAGYGDQASTAVGFEGVEQRVSVQGALGSGWSVRGQFGVAFAGGTGTRSSQEAELLKNVLPGSAGPSLAVGLGVRREWDGSSTLLARAVIGHAFAGSWLYGNFRAEKSFETGRDGLDLIVTAGWLFRAGTGVHVGVEAVAQDLEGLWEPDEAEGGARVFAGPSIHYAVPGRPFYASLCGGPVLVASRSPRENQAPRPLGTGSGFTIRLTLGYAF